MRLRIWLAAGTIALSTASLAATTSRSTDELGIRAVEQGLAGAWSAHDIGRFAAFFTPQADVVNVLGWWWTSRTEMQAKLGAAFRSVFRDSQLHIDKVAVRFLSPTIAVAHVRWTMTGARSPTGNPSLTPTVGVQTQVLEKRAGRWLISEFQNTDSVPERPFP